MRAEIQRSQASVQELSQRYNLNPKTVRKWRKRGSVEDTAMGPKTVASTVLSREDEALALAFRRHTLLPLDDCLYALQETIPHLTRSALHRLFQRHGVSQLPATPKQSRKGQFKAYRIGYFHIDIAEVNTADGKLYMFVAIDRVSKFAHAELHTRAKRRDAADFLRNLVEIVPYTIHTVLTDNGTQFTVPGGGGSVAGDIDGALRRGERARVHPFELACERAAIEHRLTKANHPWTNGQVERINRTIKDATVRRYHDEDHPRLREHLAIFLDAYNFGKRLKTLRSLTPYERICQAWNRDPERFYRDPRHHTTGLYT